MTVTADPVVARRPEQVHELFALHASAADVDGLVALFEPAAVLVPEPGTEARGAHEVREACAALCAAGARFTITTDAVHVADDLALTSGTWTATTPAGDTFGGRTTEVLRRQPDGRWLLVLDAPRWLA